jgi:tetratricopeptide (TPR) repeat protein
MDQARRWAFRGTFSWFVRPCILALALDSATWVLGRARGQTEVPKTAKPPWQRVLAGDDAKRVKELEAQIDELEKNAQFGEAVAPARRVVETRDRVQGADHWQTRSAIIKAVTLERVATLSRADRSDLASSLQQTDQGGSLHDKGRYGESEPIYRKVLAVRRRVLGEEHADTAASYLNLASALVNQGKYSEADSILQSSLAIKQRVLGEDHPGTSNAYSELGMLRTHQGRHTEAEPLYRKALAIRLLSMGENDSSTALSYNSLAANLNNQGKFAEAEPLLRKALSTKLMLLWSTRESNRLTCRGEESSG